MIWSNRAREQLVRFHRDCFFGRILASNAATESCFTGKGKHENNIARFRSFKPQNLAISNQPEIRKTTPVQPLTCCSGATATKDNIPKSLNLLSMTTAGGA